MKKLFKNKKGFTLVELMVVVAIMGVLVAVAIPVFNNVTKKAKVQTCATNCRTIEGAISQMKTLEQSTEDLSKSVTLTAENFKTEKFYNSTLDKFIKEFPTDATYTIATDGSVTAVLKDGTTNINVNKNGEIKSSTSASA